MHAIIYPFLGWLPAAIFYQKKTLKKAQITKNKTPH